MGFLKDLGKTVSNIGKGVVDVVKATHAQPIADAYQSVTGKKVDIKYNTATGKTVATGMSIVGNTSSALAKGVANGVTGGMATKATNSIRAVENRDGDGTSILGKTTGGFAQLQAEAQAKYDQEQMELIKRSQGKPAVPPISSTTDKIVYQANQMANKVGIANMPSSSLSLIRLDGSSPFVGKFWEFIFA